MIDGVKIKQLRKFADDRGFFAEILKFGEETFHEIKQTSYTETFPGVIKAFHWHKKQWDIWFVCRGNAQVVLHDLRENSATKGQTQVIFAGENNPVVIAIPPGVVHGYRVLGNEKVGMFYHTSEPYDSQNPDEERIAFNDPMIGFDWGTKNR
ncbi:dTDP-4-dehydrorhamnose 3,5-epimerase family protein [Candidatus Falkowbacteria bacterium]|nr:dTDP-4-dehydrorhamnose 3,5-epimerase family protein [Candidatus Falkowbacteria bacterium]